jgi:hypothetical protein
VGDSRSGRIESAGAGSWPFPGPHLHWDTTVAQPHHFGIQGILYLADTAENQGAFTCMPGFHRKLESWLTSLPKDADPRQEIFHHAARSR